MKSTWKSKKKGKRYGIGTTKRRHRRTSGGMRERGLIGQKQKGIKKGGKLICSPSAEKEGVMVGATKTCLTKSALDQIKMSMNAQSHADKIQVTNPNDILQTLYKRYPTCKWKDEDCLLNKLPDKKLSAILKKELLRPKSPKEWIKNPNEWLSNFNLENVLRQYEQSDPTFQFLGVSPVDYDFKYKDGQCVHETICKFPETMSSMIQHGKQKFAAIFNLSKHNEDGSHWVSLYVSIPDHMIFYFDSVGNEPPKQIRDYIEILMTNMKQILCSTSRPNCVDYYHSKKQHQRGHTECGMYSLYFIVTMISDRKKQDKMDLFLKNRISDEFVQTCRQKYFNKAI